MPGVHERVITITGSIEEEMRAVALIITKMAEDPNFPMHSSINLSYPQAGGMPASPMHGVRASPPSIPVQLRKELRIGQ